MSMSLRTQIHLIVFAVTIAMLAVVLGLHTAGTRASVKEEVEAANRVALQFLARFRDVFGVQSVADALPIVRELGRIRSNEIEVFNGQGVLQYRSPPPTYKAGREAPVWFTRLMAPEALERGFELRDGRLLLRTDASRAILDGWDDFKTLVWFGAALAVIATSLAFLAARRLLVPIAEVVEGLKQAQAGRFDFRLHERGGTESKALSGAFNRLMHAVEERDAARSRVAEAEQQRDMSRELALRFEHELEQERRSLARDLHDDLGQHATALKTLAATLERRLAGTEPSLAQLAGLMIRSADALFAAIRAMINQVRPEALERGGLIYGLRALIDDWRLRQPERRFELMLEPADEARFGLGTPAIEAAAYRIAQEAITNAVRHAGGALVIVSARAGDGRLTIQISDDGRGIDPGRRAAGLGLKSMEERVRAFSGTLKIGTGESGGTEVIAQLPWPGPVATV